MVYIDYRLKFIEIIYYELNSYLPIYEDKNVKNNQPPTQWNINIRPNNN